MDRNGARRGRISIDDRELDEEPSGEVGEDEAADSLWADSDLGETEGAPELDDQDLEIARLLGQDV